MFLIRQILSGIHSAVKQRLISLTNFLAARPSFRVRSVTPRDAPMNSSCTSQLHSSLSKTKSPESRPVSNGNCFAVNSALPGSHAQSFLNKWTVHLRQFLDDHTTTVHRQLFTSCSGVTCRSIQVSALFNSSRFGLGVTGPS